MKTLLSRFEEKYMPEPMSGCWLWTGWVGKHGYGLMKIDGKHKLAHRISHELLIGEIPAGLDIDHLCKTRCCVNPQHMEPVTRGENARRADPGRFNRAKTHCPKGHEYTPENTRLEFSRRSFGRICVTCKIESLRRLRARKKALTHS
jgi:hypothetical protein